MDHTRRFETPDASSRGLGELFRDLATDASRLIRQEAELARAEMKRNLRALLRDVAGLVLWGAVAGVGGLVLVVFLVAVLGDILDSYWLSALLVGGVLVLAGGALAASAATRLRKRKVKPDETLRSLRDTRDWAQTEAAEARTRLAGEAGPNGRTAPARTLPASRIRGAVPVEAEAAEAERTPPAREERKERGREPEEQEEDRGLLKRVWHEVMEDDVMGQAAKVAYFAFLSLPPAILVLFGLTGFFGGEDVAQWLTAELSRTLPAGASGLIEGFVDQVARRQAPDAFSIGLVLALWAASTVFVALADALNKAYDVEEDRSWLKRRGIALGVMLVFAVFFLAASVALLAGPQIAAAVGMGAAWDVLSWPVAFLLVVAGFWVIYYVLPNRNQEREKTTILRGAFIGALVWILATAAFRLYVANFGSYTETYGFIGAFIVLLLWMYVSGVAVLLGGEINSEIRQG